MTPQGSGGPRKKRIRAEVLAGYLRRTRIARGLTQEEVAARMGIDRTQYVKYENNRGMEIDKAPALADALSVPESEILALTEDRGVVAELSVQLADLRRRVERLESASA